MEPNELPLPPDFVPPPQAQAAVPVVTGAPPIPSNVQAQQPAQPSMLERLREQVMQDVMPGRYETMQARARAFGAGMLGSGGNFFQGLAAGQQAMDQQRAQEQRVRADRLQAAEAEVNRRAQQELAQAQFEYSRDPNNPANIERLARARQAVAMAGYYEQGGRGGFGAGATQRGQITPQIVQDRLRRIPSEAAAMVARRYQNAVPPPADTLRRETAAEEQRLRAEYIDSLLAMGGAGAAIAEALRGAGQGGGERTAPTESIPPNQRFQYPPPRQ